MSIADGSFGVGFEGWRGQVRVVLVLRFVQRLHGGFGVGFEEDDEIGKVVLVLVLRQIRLFCAVVLVLVLRVAAKVIWWFWCWFEACTAFAGSFGVGSEVSSARRPVVWCWF